MNKLLVILGPTSTGKTDLALNLAKKFNGEIISCDSRQVYIGLDIGTGKLPSGRWKKEGGRRKKDIGFWEMDGIRIWMYDVISPKKQYTVFNYVKDANEAITEIRKEGKLVIVVGGTGLYFRALIDGLPNINVPIDINLRKKLEKLSLNNLQNKLQELSPKRWEKMNSSDRQNPRRLIRAIELYRISTSVVKNESIEGTNDDVLRIVLTASREILYLRSDERVIERINQGMIDEAKLLYKKGLGLKRMRQLGLEYGVLADFLDGKILNVDNLIKILQNRIHGYIRRQLTWFKKEKKVRWFDITAKEFPANVEKIVAKWYYQPDDTKN